MKCEKCGYQSLFLRKKYCKNCECQHCCKERLIEYANEFCSKCVCQVCFKKKKSVGYDNCYMCNFNSKYYGTF